MPKSWTAVCEDESIVKYDSCIRAVWAKKGSTPRMLTTGSHQKTCLFGALSLGGRQLFRQYKKINEDTFISFLKEMKRKFKFFVLFIDKAPWHKKSKKVERFFDENKDCIKVVWLPTASPELNPVEEPWRQLDNDILSGLIFSGFNNLVKDIGEYFRTKRFNLQLEKYLCP